MGKGIAFFIGLVSLSIGLSLVYMRISKIKAGIVTKATVVRIIKSKSKGLENETLYKPIFRFKNYKNEPMIYTPSFSGNNDWSIGETVKIVYTKDKYDNVRMLAYFKTLGIELFFCCVALVSLFIAGGEYLAGRFFKALMQPAPIN
jgi:hypothetical protein